MEDRLQKDVSGERSVARLRLIAAAVSSIGAIWLLFLSDFAWPAIVVTLAVAAAARFWVTSWTRTERASRTLCPDLVLDGEALRLGDRVVPWADVARIELDQDRLLVRVVPERGDSLEIEPPFGGLGLDALGERIEAARRAAHPRG